MKSSKQAQDSVACKALREFFCQACRHLGELFGSSAAI